MFKEDYIDDNTRVVTRRVEDRQTCSVKFVTSVEKCGHLNWASVEQKETHVRTDAERKHEAVRKEQAQIREHARQKEVERTREQTSRDLEAFNLRESQRRVERESRRSYGR